MSQATTILMNEHRLIEQVLDCVERMAALAERDGRLEADPVRQAIDFLRTFADGCHHAKEENRLFPMMEQRGFSPASGPTAVMRHEHELGRGLIGRMDAAADGLAEGRLDEAREFVVAARAYVGLLREHIKKEDDCLFPMADQALGAEQQEALLREFDHAERCEIGEGVHERYVALADELADRFGVTKVTVEG